QSTPGLLHPAHRRDYALDLNDGATSAAAVFFGAGFFEAGLLTIASIPATITATQNRPIVNRRVKTKTRLILSS
ncbi:MAG TPA: hypothetical protein VGI55_00780, partial [Solirubrobacteraceae bacterium]